MYTQELKRELTLRVEKIRKRMQECGLDACLIAGNSNIYYLSGRIFRGYVYVPLKGEATYYVIRPFELKGGDVVYIRKPEQMPELMAAKGVELPKKLGLELDVLTYSDVVRLKNVFVDSEIINTSVMLRQCRMVKTDYEIEKMKYCGQCQAKAYARMAKAYTDGMTDLEFQIEGEKILREEGSLGFYRTSGSLMEIFMGSVLNGENADTPTPYDFAVGGGGVNQSLPVGANGNIIKEGTTIMVDMNGNFNGYQSDMTRVWKRGEVSDLAKKAHDVSRAILRELEVMALPGVGVAELYNKACEIVEANGLSDYFMGYTQKAAFIGHGVGIELNELPVLTPRSKDVLQKNMTIAIEPKFVIPNEGAVGVENTYVVTEQGLENITIFPEEMSEL